MTRSIRHTAEHPVAHPRPERPAGMQAMSPQLWALIQAAIRQLAHPA